MKEALQSTSRAHELSSSLSLNMTMLRRISALADTFHQRSSQEQAKLAALNQVEITRNLQKALVETWAKK